MDYNPTSVTIPIYCTFQDFKDCYLDDYRNLKETQIITLREYYINRAKKYREIFNDIPFGKNNFDEKINFIKNTFSEKWLHNFFLQKLIKGLSVTKENAYQITDGIAGELYNIFKFLDDEILKIPESINPNTTKNIENTSLYNEQVISYVNAIFKGDLTKIELLKYLSENFYSTNAKFTDLTKYNQIYRYFNDQATTNLEKKAYQGLIKELFGFDYGKREIKGSTIKHLEQLKNLSILFHKNHK